MPSTRSDVGAAHDDRGKNGMHTEAHPLAIAWSGLIAGLLALLLVVTVAAPASARPDDQLDPPAPGEGEPLDDPSEPEPDGDDAPAASPRATYAAEPGQRWQPPAVSVIAGATRFATAVEISRAGWPDGAAAAVLASGEDYPDALASAPLAATVQGPLLLSPAAGLDDATIAELERLAPETVYLAGGASALSSQVEARLQELGYATERIFGSDRYQTAWAIAQRAVELGAEPATLLVASGVGFADALSASALAAAERHPILLARPAGNREWLEERAAELEVERTLVIGGEGSLPDAEVDGLPGMERLAGRDRTETAVRVAERARELGLDGNIVLASAEDFPDGLAGGVLAGAVQRGPLLLTARGALSGPLVDWLVAHQPASLTQVGGRSAVGPLASCQLRTGEQRAWLCAEEALAHQGYNVGTVNGQMENQTVWAIYAFQKVAGLPVNGRWGDAEWRALATEPTLQPRRPDLGPDHIEIDLARQLILLVRDGKVAHAFHTSTGKPSTPTVRGTFSVYEKRNYRQANRMYRAIFFYRGYALHGYPEIPLHPASAGCARTYDGDQDFLWPKISMGERVFVF